MKRSHLLAAATIALLTTLQVPGALASPTHAAGSRPTPRAIFAGLNDGQIYQSVDGGKTWQESDSGLAGGPIYPLIAGAGATL